MTTDQRIDVVAAARCKYCKQLSELNYCSNCGMTVRHDVSNSPFFARLLEFHIAKPFEQTGRFVITFLLLLLRPCTYFTKLNNDESGGVHRIRIFGGKSPDGPIKMWRRPISPEAYFVDIVAVVFIVINVRSIIANKPVLGERFVQRFSWLEWIVPDSLEPFVGSLMVLGTLALMLATHFMYLYPYRWIVGRRMGQKLILDNYMSYCSAQVVLMCVLVWLIGLLLPSETNCIGDICGWSWRGVFVKHMVMLSFCVSALYYFLILPMKIFPTLWGVGKLRVLTLHFL